MQSGKEADVDGSRVLLLRRVGVDEEDEAVVLPDLLLFNGEPGGRGINDVRYTVASGFGEKEGGDARVKDWRSRVDRGGVRHSYPTQGDCGEARDGRPMAIRPWTTLLRPRGAW